MEVYGQGAVFEVSDILTGKFPKVQLEGGKFPAWKIDWKGDGDMPTKGAMITWSGQREAGSDGKEYWKMYDFEYSKTPTKPNGGPQQAAASLPQDIQRRLNQAIAIESDVNPHPMGDAVKMLEGDGRTLSIVLQVCIKSSESTAQADEWLRWYLQRSSNLLEIFVDTKS